MKIKNLAILCTLLACGQGAWAFDGDGTATSPYLIQSKDDLSQLASDVNGGNDYQGYYFSLETDLNYGDGTGSQTNYTTVGNENRKPFRGSFDGKGHTISGVVINEDSEYRGLFGALGEGGVVKNLTLDASSITASRYVGGIVGENSHGTVENCHVTSTVVFGASSNYSMDCGGVVGFVSGNSTATGGVKGCTSGATLNIPQGMHIGGVVGNAHQYSRIQDCLYYGSSISGAKSVGAIAGDKTALCVMSNNYYTIQTIRGVNGADIEDMAEMSVASSSAPAGLGSVTTTYGEGSYVGVVAYENGLVYNNQYYKLYEPEGTESDPYLIVTVADLNALADRVNAGARCTGKYFTLVNDLVYDNTSANYVLVGNDMDNPFDATFDGQGHTISGIVMDATTTNQGLFGVIEANGMVKNLTLADSKFNDLRYLGGIAVHNYGKVVNCHVKSSVTCTFDDFLYQVGGIIGYNHDTGLVAGCTAAVDLNASGSGSSSDIGGIVGFNQGQVKDCLFYGISVQGGTRNYGAIVGNDSSDENAMDNNFHTSLSVKAIGASTAGEPSYNLAGKAEYAETWGFLPPGLGPVYKHYGVGDYAGVTAYEDGLYYEGNYYFHPNVIVLYNDRDNTPVIEQYLGETVDVVLKNRIFYKDGNWNSLVVPFSYSKYTEEGKPESIFGEDATLIHLNSAKFDKATGTLTINFGDDMTQTSPGEPFFFKWNTVGENIIEPRFEQVTIGDKYGMYDPYTIYGSEDWRNQDPSLYVIAFQGSYAPVTLEADDRTKLYLGADSKLYYPSAEVEMGAMRCWIELMNGLKAGDLSDEVNTFQMNFGEETTGIDSPAISLPSNDAWYTIDGRKLKSMPFEKGIYINNGHKVVIK